MKLNKNLLGLLILIVFQYNHSQAQFNYSFQIDTFRIAEAARLHSFSFGRIADTLLIFGGRKDGLHDKASGFERDYSNRSLILFDLSKNIAQTISLESLDSSLLESLSSSNTNFCQRDNKLIVLGGYGQNSKGNYVTYSRLIQIDLVQLLNLIAKKENINPAFKQISNDTFAIAGGQLKYIDNKFFLVGGHRFDGKYSNNSKGYFQTYTESAYLFNLVERGDSLQVIFQNRIRDELNFHRRDFNLCPFVTERNKVEPVAFSGVFLVNENRPFLNISSIQSDNYTDIPNFNQRLANYQCAKIGFYSSSQDQMNEVFFGGMAEYYYDSTKNLIRDPLIPFVNTISRVERDSSGLYQEFALQNTMPGYIGTNAEFILNSKIKLYDEEIVALDELNSDSIFIGSILGGIYNYSNHRNAFQDSVVSFTQCNPYLLKVNLIKVQPTKINEYPISIKNEPIELLPNPIHEKAKLRFEKEYNKITLWLLNAEGKLISEYRFKNKTEIEISMDLLPSGSYHFYYLINEIQFGKINFLKL